MKTWVHTLLPGLALIGLAFWAGTHKNFWLGLAGFLSFFVAGVTVLVEGRRHSQGKTPSTAKPVDPPEKRP